MKTLTDGKWSTGNVSEPNDDLGQKDVAPRIGDPSKNPWLTEWLAPGSHGTAVCSPMLADQGGLVVECFRFLSMSIFDVFWCYLMLNLIIRYYMNR